MMPGVVMMENGVRAPLPTNHDRDHSQFLVNGNGAFAPQSTSDRPNGAPVGSGLGDKGSSAMINGDEAGDGAKSAQPQRINTNPSRMNDLPDEIQHVTMGFVPLGLLLSRLAQKTHNQLGDEIMALAKTQLPATAINGNSAHISAATDDTSPENLAKKSRLLNFVQEKHAEWVKVAVIARWSRNAESVSKLIDLMGLLRQQQAKYMELLDQMITIKSGLAFARLPNPDLRTAHYVLSTGAAPWMPDLNYLEPPPLTNKEQLQWIENVNTLLSLRLNLEDYDSIPYHFRDYTIHSGRVTFKVPGEFEVDLTIADEDFEKQFWFIDFRFAFTPAPAELSDALRMYLEGKVNEALEKDGLNGCFTYLHEFVLTHKISEYMRQALELSRGRWVDTLKIERLNRAMSIQYWVGRYPPEGPRSWIILGVHSGRKANTAEDPKSCSHLTLRWFKDNKEVMDADIPLNEADISTEDLLNRVIARHVNHILFSIYSKLKLNGRYIKREAGLVLDVHKDDPTQSSLKMQLGYGYHMTVGISSATGMFSMSPQTNITWLREQRLNWNSKDPVPDGLSTLEGIRCQYFADEIKRRGKGAGWFISKAPAKMDTIKESLKLRELGQLLWLRRNGWTDQWYIMVNLSLSGDKWWLMEIKSHDKGARISSCTSLPLSSNAPNLGDQFFSDLTIFTAALISQTTDLRTLRQRRIKQVTHDGTNYSLPASMKVPDIFIRLSDILKRPSEPEKRAASWARDFVQIMFKGAHKSYGRPQILDRDGVADTGAGTKEKSPKESLRVFMDARLKVSDASRFGLLKGHVGRDVAFDRRLGVFALRLEADIGTSILDTLAHRLQAIDKLADCIDAIRRSDRDIQCEEITLTKVVITYTDKSRSEIKSEIKSESDTLEQSHNKRWKATLSLNPDAIKLSFEKYNPQLRALDHFRHLINSELRCLKLPFFLTSTLPVHRALDAVEDAWDSFAANNQGRVEVFAYHLDWYALRYYLPGPNRVISSQRRLSLQIRLREHNEEAQWHVFREESGAVKRPDDEFKQALDKVINAEDRQWQSLVDCAASKTDNRVGELIMAIDESIRRLAMQSPTLVKQNQPKTQMQAKNPAHASYHRNMATTKARAQGSQAVVILDD
ncbi:MED14-domain-containing protein [Hypoxylon sp. FL1150]|nr:MED14-domain-containing protein [Hypoxylon sp. FL1150]